MANVDEFLKICNDNIQREGRDRFLAWLTETDFFEAPASTRFHLSRPGGLAEHSLNVYHRLCKMTTKNTPESIAICALFHDVCKANYYSVEYRNRKDANGRWEQYPFYVVNDLRPYGHGEKSVYLISKHMRLTEEEAMAIRWHMGGFDDAVKGGSYAMGAAWNLYPLGVLLHCADLQATYIDEVED